MAFCLSSCDVNLMKNAKQYITDLYISAFFGQKTLAFIIGRRAQAFLLSGAVKSKTIVEHARTLIQYTKPGGFTKARSDFHSVEPTDVIDIKPLCDGVGRSKSK